MAPSRELAASHPRLVVVPIATIMASGPATVLAWPRFLGAMGRVRRGHNEVSVFVARWSGRSRLSSRRSAGAWEAQRPSGVPHRGARSEHVNLLWRMTVVRRDVVEQYGTRRTAHDYRPRRRRRARLTLSECDAGTARDAHLLGARPRCYGHRPGAEILDVEGPWARRPGHRPVVGRRMTARRRRECDDAQKPELQSQCGGWRHQSEDTSGVSVELDSGDIHGCSPGQRATPLTERGRLGAPDRGIR